MAKTRQKRKPDEKQSDIAMQDVEMGTKRREDELKKEEEVIVLDRYRTLIIQGHTTRIFYKFLDVICQEVEGELKDLPKEIRDVILHRSIEGIPAMIRLGYPMLNTLIENRKEALEKGKKD